MAAKARKPPRQERLKFYAALGEALVKWAYVEYCLQRALGKFVTGDPDSIPAASAYFAVIGFKARFDMVNHAARIRLSATDFKQFGKLMDWCSKLSKDRNRLAHYYVRDDRIANSDGYRFHSVPFFRDPNYYEYSSTGKPKKSQEYNVDDLKSFATACLDLGEVLFPYINTVKLERTRRPTDITRALPP